MSGRSIERLSWPAIVGMILLPVLVFGSFLGLATTQAAPLGAIINNDQPTNVAGEMMTLGDEVAQGMIEDKNISWEITDAETAEQGLKDGKYAAAVTIASDFTKKAASFTNNNAAETSTALLEIKVSDNTTLVDGLVAQIVNSVATDSVNAALSEAYLDGLMLGFNEVHGALELIADGTKQIQDGSKELSEGAGEAKDGSLELNDGLRQLSNGSNELFAGTMELRAGTQELRTGAGQLDAGAAELQAGTKELADGAKQLDAGAAELQAATKELADGAGQLNAGVGELAAGLAELLDGVMQLDAGASEIQAGADELNTGAGQLDAGAAELQAGTAELKAGTAELKAGTAELADGVGQLEAGAGELSGGLTQLREAVQNEVVPGLQQLVDGAMAVDLNMNDPAIGLNPGVGYRFSQDTMNFIKANNADLGFSPEQLARLEALVMPDFSSMTPDEIQKQANTVTSAIQQLADGSLELAAGTAELNTGINGADGLVPGLMDAFTPLVELNPFDKAQVSQPDSIANQLLTEMATELANTYAGEVSSQREKWYAFFIKSQLNRLEDAMVTQIRNDPTVLVPTESEFGSLQAEICSPHITGATIAKCHLNLAKLGYGFLMMGAQGLAGGVVGDPTVSEGLNALAAGAQELNAGAAQLRDGLLDLQANVNFDRQPVPEYNQNGDVVGMKLGAAPGGSEKNIKLEDTLGAGVAMISTGVPDVTAGLQQLQAGISLEAGRAAFAASGATTEFDPTNTVEGAVLALEAGSQELVGGMGQVSSGVAELDAGAIQLNDGAGQLDAGAAELKAGTAELAGGTALLLAGAGDLKAGTAELLDGAKQLNAGAGELKAGMAELNAGAGDLNAGAGELKAGMAELNAGAGDLNAGAGELKAGTKELAVGSGQLNVGAGELKAGMAELNAGAGELSDGAGQIKGGTQELASGAGQLDAGAGELSDGAGQISAGLGDAYKGSGELAEGLGLIADGSKELSDGATELHEGVSDGLDEIPTFNDADRKVLSSAGAAPVKKQDVVTPGTYAMVGILVASLLWGMGLIGATAAGAGAGMGLATRSAGISAVAGGVLGAVAASQSGAGVGGWAGLLLTGAGLGVSFAFIAMALVGWLGNIGKAILLGMLALTIVLGITAGTTGWLRAIGTVSPLENGADLMRAIMSGGSVTMLAATAVIFAIAGIAGTFALKFKGAEQAAVA